jgi:inner membrane protein
MFLGALAQSIPDIDFVTALWNNTASNLLAHRGFTHSIVFGGLATAGFGLLAEHYHKKHQIGFNKWVLFFGLQIAIHILIDLFNNYGIGLFEPFSHLRYSFNAMFVADPFFSIGPAIAFVALLILKPRVKRRDFWWRFGVTCSFAYLLMCVFNKTIIDKSVKQTMAAQKIPHRGFLTTPTPLNNLLWYVAINNDSEFFIGFSSVFDKSHRLNLHRFAKNDSLLKQVSAYEDLQHLIRFSQGYYTVEKWHDTLVFNDLRFGQMIGWYNPNEHFVFHYFLNKGKDNKLVVQRGRFANWSWTTTRSMLNRIKGE